jgi:hypothetical protein
VSGWRDRFVAEDEVVPVPFRRDVLLSLTGAGANAVTAHARSRGLSRQEWIRRAIAAQMEAEGAAHVPDMRPYMGTALRMGVSRG